ncbi:hypothetical protein F5887DRAFT_998191 [Amanita rubescens]|nr:hypothetical protein F5887DRAFT_998191 [Amanita rubescens]
MESLGHALSSCSSVMQFLKAMYDLVEVHRMLVEDHNVLHRDISWGNVLINPTHVDKDQKDDLCDRPFIDVIHDVRPEARKVHVMLSDFDCACILGNSKMREPTRGEIAGTPMFMARSLSSRPLGSTPNTVPRLACELVFSSGATGPTDQRRKEVEEFRKIVNEYGDLLLSGMIPFVGEKPETGIAHAPMHDAESIFWLIVLFFLRAHPKGYDHTNAKSGERERRRHRTAAFKSMVMNAIEMGLDSREPPNRKSLPPQFHPFVKMMVKLDMYFRQSWHDPYFSNFESEAIRFHAHNALQVVLLDAINKLQTTGDIEVHAMPLGVDDDFPYIPLSKSFVSASLKRGIPDDGEGDKKGKKRQKTTQVTKTSSLMITKSNRDDTAIMIEKNPEFKTLMSAIDHDKQSKRWFMGDREYVEYAFVEA